MRHDPPQQQTCRREGREPDATVALAVAGRAPRARPRGGLRPARGVRAAGVGLVTAAAVLGLAGCGGPAGAEDPVAAPPEPSPPASVASEPTQERTTTPTPEPTTGPTEDPQPTPEPTEAHEPPETPEPAQPLFALTDQGELVRLDPVTGETLEVVVADAAFTGGAITVDRERRTAYLQTTPPQVPLAWPTITRVSLPDGTTEPLDDGHGAALSPDGGTLAYITSLDGPTDSPADRALALLDLRTGETRLVPDGAEPAHLRNVGAPRWSPDGDRILLMTGWWDSDTGISRNALTVIDLAALPASLVAAPTLDVAAEGGPEGGEIHRSIDDGWLLPDGRLVAEETVVTVTADGAGSERRYHRANNLLVVVDGAVTSRVALPTPGSEISGSSVYISSLVLDADSGTFAVTVGRRDHSALYTWDGGQAFTELRSGVASVTR